MGGSSSVQERRKIHELLTTLQEQEQHLFDTGKCRANTTALQERHAAAETAARAALRVSSGGCSSAALPGTSGSAAVAQHHNSGFGAGGHLEDKGKHAGKHNSAGDIKGRSAEIDAPPLPTMPSTASGCFGDPQFQQLMRAILEQLRRITDAQRSLAARIARLESVLDDPYKHRASAHSSQPAAEPSISVHPQPQPHPRVHLNRNATYPVDLASAAAFGGIDGQLGTLLQYNTPSNLVPPSLRGYAAPAHHLPHPSFL
jgi:hypothetical protein